MRLLVMKRYHWFKLRPVIVVITTDDVTILLTSIYKIAVVAIIADKLTIID
jgi:hypothetical protein